MKVQHAIAPEAARVKTEDRTTPTLLMSHISFMDRSKEHCDGSTCLSPAANNKREQDEQPPPPDLRG
jgi:hypothetical protein